MMQNAIAPMLASMLLFFSVGCFNKTQVRSERESDQAQLGVFSDEGIAKAVEQIDDSRGTKQENLLYVQYAKQFKLDPKNPYKRFLYAYSFKDRNKAWQELVNVTKLNESFYWAYFGMAVIMDQWKIDDQAHRNFKKAISLDPDIGIGYARYGRMQMRLGNFAKAAELLQQAIDKDATQLSYLLDLGKALWKTGKKAEAIATYEEVIETKPDSFRGHLELATCVLQSGDKTRAIKLLQKAVELNPKSYEAHLELAKLLGESPDAIDIYKKACSLRPSSVDCYRRLAVVAGKLNLGKIQRETYETMIGLDKRDLAANTFLGPLYLQEGAIESALPCYQVMLQADPKNIQAMLGLAEIYEKGEEFSKAMEFNQKVLDNDQNNKSAHAAMDRLFQRFHILPERIKGSSPESVFAKNRRQIAEVYKLRLAKKPAMRGDLLIKVAVSNEGVVEAVNVSKNTVGDQFLEICAVWNLRRSLFPSGFGATYNFALTLKPGS